MAAHFYNYSCLSDTCSGVGDTIYALLSGFVLAQLSLVHRHKVIGQALSRDWVRLWNDFLDSLGRVSINEAEVLEVLVIRRREVKVGRNVAR